MKDYAARIWYGQHDTDSKEENERITPAHWKATVINTMLHL